MPLYEFRCNRCGTITEFLTKMGDTGESFVCPECGSGDLSKMMSVAAAVTSSPGTAKGKTCCGRDERCDNPPCGTSHCRR